MDFAREKKGSEKLGWLDVERPRTDGEVEREDTTCPIGPAYLPLRLLEEVLMVNWPLLVPKQRPRHWALGEGWANYD